MHYQVLVRNLLPNRNQVSIQATSSLGSLNGNAENAGNSHRQRRNYNKLSLKKSAELIVDVRYGWLMPLSLSPTLRLT